MTNSRSEVDLAAAPLLALHLGGDENVASHESQVIIVEIPHLHEDVAAAQAWVHIGNRVFAVVGRRVLHVVDEGLDVVARRSGQGQGLGVKPHVLVGLGDTACVAFPAAVVEQLASGFDLLFVEGHLGAIRGGRHGELISAPLGCHGWGGKANQQRHRQNQQGSHHVASSSA